MDHQNPTTGLVHLDGATKPPSAASLSTSFPILIATVTGMLASAVLLVGYYAFVTRFRVPRPPAGAPEPPRGLEPDLILAIPIVDFPPPCSSVRECAVCLSEFGAGEKLKLLPSCAHAFHIDCIDTWLQFNANCPLCRSSVAVGLREEGRRHRGGQAASSPEEEVAAAATRPKRGSVGDECIDVRGKDEEFGVVQPMRRSFSMDSSSRRQLAVCISIQEMMNISAGEKRRQQQPSGGGEGSSTASPATLRIRRSFFSFGRSCNSSALAVV